MSAPEINTTLATLATLETLNREVTALDTNVSSDQKVTDQLNTNLEIAMNDFTAKQKDVMTMLSTIKNENTKDIIEKAENAIADVQTEINKFPNLNSQNIYICITVAQTAIKEVMDKIISKSNGVTTVVQQGVANGVATKEENIYVKFDGLVYNILNEKDGANQMETEENIHVKTVFKMTRPDAKSCFTLNDGSSKRSLLNIVTMGKYGKGGNLKTKKRRITKKRVQKLRAFKSRSKK